MQAHVTKLLGRFWDDDCGAVITSEYLALGTIVVLGSVGGLAAIRDANVAEMEEYGNAVTSLDQSYSIPAAKNCLASRGGSSAYDSAAQAQGGRRGSPGGYQFTPPEDLLTSP